MFQPTRLPRKDKVGTGYNRKTKFCPRCEFRSAGFLNAHFRRKHVPEGASMQELKALDLRKKAAKKGN